MLRVLELTLRSVMSHKETSLEFPATGVVLVTGTNGAGKSSIIEAVSVGVWGESLRKKPVWADGAGSIVATASVGDAVVRVERTRSRKKEDLQFAVAGVPPQRFDTKTQAQEALDRVVGEHGLWRRTCAFSSSDRDYFTLATDAVRKRLLEDILGLDRFDSAQKLAAATRRDSELRLSTLRSDVSTFEGKYATAKAQAAKAEETMSAVIGTHRDLDVIKAEFTEARSESDVLHEVLEASQEDVRKIEERLSRIGAEVEAREAQASRASKLTKCPTCQQSVDPKHVRRLCEEVQSAQARAQAEEAKLRSALERAKVHASERRVLVNAGVKRQSVLQQELLAAQSAAKQRAAMGKGSQALAAAVEEAADAADAGRVALVEAEVAHANLVAAERVLSTGGVRAHLLTEALGGIEHVANGWLQRMTGEALSLRLSPYAEKGSSVKDSISLEVDGAGGGHGYHGASGGERRRIDVAVMLALAEIAAVDGDETGTMFFDEVFDALDDDGVTAVCSVLEDLARTRCVVVITHNTRLRQELRCSVHWNIVEGKIE